jgi:5-methylcytosine-specific restriction endonuclease McrA
VYARDDHRCQYCGSRFPPSQLTFDHVVPVARGGRKEWDNIVTCCIPCNRLKGNSLPDEVGLHLLRRPRRPPAHPHLMLSLGLRRAPESWRDYLFWDLAWDES